MKRLTKQEKEVVDEMYAFLQICLFMVEDQLGENWTASQLADAVGLSASTIYRLRNKETVRPQFMTIQKLGRFVGLSLVEGKVKVRPKARNIASRA